MGPDFHRLWTGQTVSAFGSLVGRAALGWCAVLVLGATPWQMALLGLCDLLPGVALGLFAGAFVDRLPRRPVLIATDLLRAVLTALIPLASAAGRLDMTLLFVLAPLLGACTALFDIAYGAYVPALVPPARLADANGRLAASMSAAEILAFGIAGWLVAWLGAPNAIAVDAGTFVVSALALAAIRSRETVVRGAVEDESGLLREVRAGLGVVWESPVLRSLAGMKAGLLGGGAVVGALYTLFVTRTLALDPKWLGMVAGIGGATSLLGAVLAPALGRRFGRGRAALGGLFLSGLGCLTIPLSPGRPAWAGYASLSLNQCLTDPGWTVFEVHETTIRQTAAPERVLGRVNGVFRVVSLAAQVMGTLAAGAMGERLGPRVALFIGAGFVLLTFLAALASPLRRPAVHSDTTG